MFYCKSRVFASFFLGRTFFQKVCQVRYKDGRGFRKFARSVIRTQKQNQIVLLNALYCKISLFAFKIKSCRSQIYPNFTETSESFWGTFLRPYLSRGFWPSLITDFSRGFRITSCELLPKMLKCCLFFRFCRDVIWNNIYPSWIADKFLCQFPILERPSFTAVKLITKNAKILRFFNFLLKAGSLKCVKIQ